MSRGTSWRDGVESPKVDMAAQERAAERVEKLATLQDMLAGSAWRETCVPALRARMRRIESALAMESRIDLERVRYLQAQHKLLRWLVEDPKAVFGNIEEEAAE